MSGPASQGWQPESSEPHESQAPKQREARSAEAARGAERRRRAERERRIVDLNARGSIDEIAVWERLTVRRMRNLVPEILVASVVEVMVFF